MRHHMKRDYFDSPPDVCDAVFNLVKGPVEEQAALKIWQRVMNKVISGIINRVERSETRISRALRDQLEEDILSKLEGD